MGLEIEPYITMSCGIAHKWNLNPLRSLSPAFRLLIPIPKVQPVITVRAVTVGFNPPAVPLGHHPACAVSPHGRSKSMETIIGERHGLCGLSSGLMKQVESSLTLDLGLASRVAAAAQPAPEQVERCSG